MGKLELNQLKGYLSTGLKMKYTGEGKPFRDTKKIEELTIQNIELLMFSNQRKPILRPLSDLTKEIKLNGEKFVPILELYKMRTQHMTDKIDKYYIENDTAILKLQEITTPDGRLSFVSYFEIDIEFENIHFSICTETLDNTKDEIIEERFGFIGNDFNMLQKLYEWHFDIHGLIEKGLAIDINTIKS